MHFAEELYGKVKTKSVRKFSKEVGVPRVKNTKSMKHKNKDFIENNQEELVTELIERDIKEIVKEYETNPYFRTKLNILLKELDEYKKQEIISNEIKEKKNPEKKDQLLSLKQKLKNWKNTQRIKLSEIGQQIQKARKEKLKRK